MMETNVNIQSIDTTGNDEYIDNYCAPCSKDGKFKEGSKFCEDCGTYICLQCVKDHCKFSSMESHQILDDANRGSESRNKSGTELCYKHHGRILDKYCKDHDEVCCGACVSGSHRSCVNIMKIEEAAKNVDIKEQKEANECMDKVIAKIIAEQDERGLLLSLIDQEAFVILKDIDKQEESIIKRIKDLAEASRKEVVSRHAKFETDIKADVKELESVLSVSEEVSKKLNNSNSSAVQAFVCVRKSKTVAKSVSDTLEELSKCRSFSIDYCFNNERIQKFVGMKSLGYFEETANIPYKAKKQGMINVKLEKDGDCIITGICFLENETIIIADSKNKKLKMLNENYEMKNNIALAGYPSSLCNVGPHEVAVALRNEGKVQFVSCDDTLSLGFSFSTSQRCAGLYFDTKHDELYVSCDSWAQFSTSKVRVFTKTGILTRTFEKDETGKMLFLYPKNITMEPITDTVYIADERNGIIALHRNGKLKWKYQSPEVRDLAGICMLPGNQVLVTGCSSKNLVQVGDDGKEVCELLGASEDLPIPYTVVCDKRNSKIIVGGASNEIHIYALRTEKTISNV
ncbi:uncharacterized protein LOC132746321 [Ruditapes philippinarum]|uniref:uncharacterized protein LOC132746321 n=1 Tax=Ruditapes philippinarum TaxID=129788 RepID=UPI00295C0AD2|nr:uncharacterized protein LOC132746321 [Ruditapes philippinarum]